MNNLVAHRLIRKGEWPRTWKRLKAPETLYIKSIKLYFHSKELNTFFLSLTRDCMWHWLAQNMDHAVWMQSGM